MERQTVMDWRALQRAFAGYQPGSPMQAAVFRAPGELSVKQVPIPTPGAKQVLVRLEGCGVSAPNLRPWAGQPRFEYPLPPGSPGHEGWGHIAALGADVEDVAVGDRVALLSSNAYAEYDVADANAVVKLPTALDGEPFPAESLACAVNIFARSQIGPRQTVAIVGIGFLGALLTSLAAQARAEVIAISRRPFALEVAHAHGAAHIIPMDDHRQIIERVNQLTGGAGCDCVIEAVGKQRPLDLATELTRERGRLIVAGYHQDGPRTVNMQQWNWRGLDVINAHERDPAVYVAGMHAAVNAVVTGRWDPSALYTHCFHLDQLGSALEMVDRRPHGFLKALIKL